MIWHQRTREKLKTKRLEVVDVDVRLEAFVVGEHNLHVSRVVGVSAGSAANAGVSERR